MYLITTVFGKYIKLDSFAGVCSSYENSKSDYLMRLPKKTKTTWDIRENYKYGKELGKGSFGLVKLAELSDSETGKKFKVAIKKMSPTTKTEVKLILKELSALMSMYESQYAPKIFGCHIDKHNDIYIVQEKLGGDLNDLAFKQFYRKGSRSTSINIIRQMVEGLFDLWSNGYAHNDIKPANMMHRDNLNEIVLIDFGLASQKTNSNKHVGTPIFMSPSKFTETDTQKPKDDLYSIAITTAVLESGSYDKVFQDITSTYGATIGCFKMHNNSICRQYIRKNVRKIFKNLGFEEDNSNQKKISEMNFATLMIEMIRYDNFNFSYEEVIKRLKELEEMEAKKENKKVLAEEEKKQIDNQAKNYNKLIEDKDKIENEKIALAKENQQLYDEKEKIKQEKLLVDKKIREMEEMLKNQQLKHEQELQKNKIEQEKQQRATKMNIEKTKQDNDQKLKEEVNKMKLQLENKHKDIMKQQQAYKDQINEYDRKNQAYKNKLLNLKIQLQNKENERAMIKDQMIFESHAYQEDKNMFEAVVLNEDQKELDQESLRGFGMNPNAEKRNNYNGLIYDDDEIDENIGNMNKMPTNNNFLINVNPGKKMNENQLKKKTFLAEVPKEGIPNKEINQAQRRPIFESESQLKAELNKKGDHFKLQFDQFLKKADQNGQINNGQRVIGKSNLVVYKMIRI